MKKQEEEQKVIYELEHFESQCHLWNIIPGGSGKEIVKLRKIIDALQSDNYSAPGNKKPSILITAVVGKQLVINAITNSLALIDVRECHGKYFENYVSSYHFFNDSYPTTAHVITNLEQLRGRAESTLWKFLKNRECSYYNAVNGSFDKVIHCNGLIIMSCSNVASVPSTILRATDHVIRLEPLTSDQMLAAIHQRLVFCSIEYDGEQVLQAIVEQGAGQMRQVIEFLKVCIMVMKAELLDYLDMTVVNKAKRLWQVPAPIPPDQDDIPF